MEIINDLRLAVLIDADNVPYANIKEMLEEITKYGTPTFKRIYADWTNLPFRAGKPFYWKMPLPLFSNTVTQPARIQAIVP